MESSRITTLFAETPPARRGPSSFVVSLVLHVVVIGSLYLHLKHRVRVDDEAMLRRYTVRLLSLWRPDPKMPRKIDRSSKQMHRGEAVEMASGGGPAMPSLAQQPKDRIPAPQTLVQPDLPPNLVLKQQTPVPLLLIWSPENNSARMILPPPPQEQTVANVLPDLTAPNREVELANVQISASSFVTDAPLPLPSTTSPVAVRGPGPVEQVSETASKPLGPPTPARVLSLSDFHLERGTTALPMVNEIAAMSASDAMAPIREINPSKEGTGTTASSQTGAGAGDLPGHQPGKDGGSANSAGSAAATGAAGPDAPQGADTGSGVQPSVTRVLMPRDGKFGVVVVGSSMAEQYPETVGLWGSRMAYTVYLHVGSAKNWILQYSLPSAADTGTVTRIDAPWPYEMERPELAPEDLNGDAIIVRGFVNTSGRFEKLALVFPVDFAQAKFVLSALEKWRFRAAMQDGLLTTVEVLLIIPAAE